MLNRFIYKLKKMNRTKEIILTNPGFHTMEHNGYIKSAIPLENFDRYLVLIKFNKEYFN